MNGWPPVAPSLTMGSIADRTRSILSPARCHDGAGPLRGNVEIGKARTLADTNNGFHLDTVAVLFGTVDSLRNGQRGSHGKPQNWTGNRETRNERVPTLDAREDKTTAPTVSQGLAVSVSWGMVAGCTSETSRTETVHSSVSAAS